MVGSIIRVCEEVTEAVLHHHSSTATVVAGQGCTITIEVVMIEAGMVAGMVLVTEVEDSLKVEIRLVGMIGMVAEGHLETTVEVAIVKWAARAIWVVKTQVRETWGRGTWTGEVETLTTITEEVGHLLSRRTQSPRVLSSRTTNHPVPSNRTLSLLGPSNLTRNRQVLSNRTDLLPAVDEAAKAVVKIATFKEINSRAALLPTAIDPNKCSSSLSYGF